MKLHVQAYTNGPSNPRLCNDSLPIPAVLLWLSYNSSYDQWVEQWKTMAQDDNLEGVVTDAPTLPLIRNQEGADSTLFLQLTVQELGICIPILPSVQVR